MGTTMSDEKNREDWTWSWEQHELDQLRYGARLSFAEKLAWLEEALELADALQRRPSVTHE